MMQGSVLEMILAEMKEFELKTGWVPWNNAFKLSHNYLIGFIVLRMGLSVGKFNCFQLDWTELLESVTVILIAL